MKSSPAAAQTSESSSASRSALRGRSPSTPSSPRNWGRVDGGVQDPGAGRGERADLDPALDQEVDIGGGVALVTEVGAARGTDGPHRHRRARRSPCDRRPARMGARDHRGDEPVGRGLVGASCGSLHPRQTRPPALRDTDEARADGPGFVHVSDVAQRCWLASSSSACGSSSCCFLRGLLLSLAGARGLLVTGGALRLRSSSPPSRRSFSLATRPGRSTPESWLSAARCAGSRGHIGHLFLVTQRACPPSRQPM